MVIKEVSVGKEFKVGLPNYSNITARCDIKVEVVKGERVDWTELWDTVNHELAVQSNTIDPAWMQTKSYANYFKTTIKTPKVSFTPSGDGDGPTGAEEGSKQ